MKLSLNDNFCSSPWFHVRITPEGNYMPCRWASWDSYKFSDQYNVNNISIIDYMNSEQMNSFRKNLLDGKSSSLCEYCYYEESQNKISGRIKQLNKNAIKIEDFEKTFCSNSYWDNFLYSYNNQGQTKTQPIDLQIDLGNTCNSACIMCPPRWSSKSADTWEKLNLLDNKLFPTSKKFKNWSDDDFLVEKITNELNQIDNIKYIHFLGGETLFMKGFYNICERLIESGKSKTITLGTTTNCTVFDSKIEKIIKNFKEVHLGLSIETVVKSNNYIRWPSQINNVLDNIKNFLALREKSNLNLELRITPNILSVYHLDELFEFMISNNIIAESCNIMREPVCLRIELLPSDIKKTIINKIKKVIEKYNLHNTDDQIVNRRNPVNIAPVISKIIFEYLHFLENYEPLSDLEEERKNLVNWLTAYESVRGNKILDYLPEYEEFLRSIGYQA